MRTTKEEMMERFRLYGEIYCMIEKGYENKVGHWLDDFFVLSGGELDELFGEDIDTTVELKGEKGKISEISYENEMINVFFITEEGYEVGRPIIQYSTQTISKIKNIIERYIKAMKEAES